MLLKSLQLFPLPGVEALHAHAKSKADEANNTAPPSQTSSSGSSNGRGAATPTTNESGRSTPQNAGADGRAYSADQVLIVKRVLTAKEGGRGAHYRVLDITSTAGESEIKKAYRKLSLKVHPDKVCRCSSNFRFVSVDKWE